jgi:spore coat protein CotH
VAGIHWRALWILGPALALAVAVRAGGVTDALPLYRLHIAPGPLQELMAFRERILDLAFLPPGQRLWIPASFEADGERYPVRIRIRGDLPAHWREDKLSYRVKFDDGLFRGRKEINLIVPWDKHYGVELLQTGIARDLGLASFPGRFVDLVINGEDVGLYYENEHPTREYLERTGRPASSIFTFASNWTLYFSNPHHHVIFEKPGSREYPPISSVGQIKQRRTYDPRDPALAHRQLEYAADLFALLSEGTPDEIARRAGRFLDLDSFARYVALQDFLGTNHGIGLNDNTRLYLDPTRGLFEFMPWDTRLASLRERLEVKGGDLDVLLEPSDNTFRELLNAVPGLRAHRDALLRGLVVEGEAYRARLVAIHDGLLARHPDDERLRRRSAELDQMFRDNLDVLAAYLDRDVGGSR